VDLPLDFNSSTAEKNKSVELYISRGREARRWTLISCKSISAMTDFGIVHREKGRGKDGGGQLSCHEAKALCSMQKETLST